MLVELILAAWTGPTVRLASIKFLAPVRPGDCLVLDFAPVGDGSAVRFEGRREARPVLRGLLRVQPTGA
jgi:acyl dehydratase